MHNIYYAVTTNIDLYLFKWQTETYFKIRERNVRELSNIVETLIQKSDLNPTFSDVFVKWNEIIGESIAQYVEPHKVVKMNGFNILIVRAKNCCTTEIQHDSLKIIEKLNEYFKKDFFSAIRII